MFTYNGYICACKYEMLICTYLYLYWFICVSSFVKEKNCGNQLVLKNIQRTWNCERKIFFGPFHKTSFVLLTFHLCIHFFLLLFLSNKHTLTKKSDKNLVRIINAKFWFHLNDNLILLPKRLKKYLSLNTVIYYIFLVIDLFANKNLTNAIS